MTGKRIDDKPWTAAIKRACLANDGKALDMMARVLVAQASSGDMAAIKEIGDRLEGKPLQAIDAQVASEYRFAMVPAKMSQAEWLDHIATKGLPKPLDD